MDRRLPRRLLRAPTGFPEPGAPVGRVRHRFSWERRRPRSSPLRRQTPSGLATRADVVVGERVVVDVECAVCLSRDLEVRRLSFVVNADNGAVALLSPRPHERYVQATAGPTGDLDARLYDLRRHATSPFVLIESTLACARTRRLRRMHWSTHWCRSRAHRRRHLGAARAPAPAMTGSPLRMRSRAASTCPKRFQSRTPRGRRSWSR